MVDNVFTSCVLLKSSCYIAYSSCSLWYCVLFLKNDSIFHHILVKIYNSLSFIVSVRDFFLFWMLIIFLFPSLFSISFPSLMTLALLYELKVPRWDFQTGRQLRTSPLYDRLDTQGARWMEKHGFERSKYFVPAGKGEALSMRHMEAKEVSALPCSLLQAQHFCLLNAPFFCSLPSQIQICWPWIKAKHSTNQTGSTLLVLR